MAFGGEPERQEETVPEAVLVGERSGVRDDTLPRAPESWVFTLRGAWVGPCLHILHVWKPCCPVLLGQWNPSKGKDQLELISVRK